MVKLTRRSAARQIGAAGLGLALGAGGPFGHPGSARSASRAPAASAQGTGDDPVYGAWEKLPLESEVGTIFTPTSGALLVQAHTGPLYRADDGGLSWRQIALPPPDRIHRVSVTIDPTDHTVGYAVASRVLHRSTDDLASWQPIATAFFETFDDGAMMPWISPAAPSLMYFALKTRTGLVVGRSQDRGDTWERAIDEPKTGQYGVQFIVPHPIDPNRVTLGFGYTFGGTVPPPDEVWVSADRGTSWAPVAAPTGLRWVGGSGALAGTVWSIGATLGPPDPNTTGPASAASRRWTTRIMRSTDDGVTWGSVFSLGETKFEDGPVRQVLLAPDTTRPDRLFGSLPVVGATDRHARQIRVSADGGQTWNLAGAEEPPKVDALAVGTDGRTVFAGSRAGLWRLALS